VSELINRMSSYHCSDNVNIEWNKSNQAIKLYVSALCDNRRKHTIAGLIYYRIYNFTMIPPGVPTYRHHVQGGGGGGGEP
jgi:hypothetical protein